MCGAYWDNHDDFVKDITNWTISYAQDLVDPAMKSKWLMVAVDQAAFVETNTGCRKRWQGKLDAAVMQATILDVLMVAMPAKRM